LASKQEIVVNGRAMARRMTGVERYTLEVARCLGSRLRVIRPSRAIQGPAGHLWEQLILPLHITRAAVLWSPANSGPVRVRRQVVSIHDLSPIEHPEWFRPSFARLYRLLLPRLVARTRAVIVPSNYTKRRLLDCFPNAAYKIFVVPEGVDQAHFYPRERAEVEGLRRRRNLPEEYVLAVGSLQPRKNLPGLLAAWESVQAKRPSLALVIAGAHGPQFRTPPLTASTPGVRFLGYVPEKELPALYSGAMSYVCASFEEGFGLTVLEAMACGAPVVASRFGALPELVDQAGLLIDPRSRRELAARLERLTSDAELRAELTVRARERAQSFTWEKTARRIGELLYAAA
jgi:glycosyltransferase involved in cell wall biosynthesis